jgi:hypothetical protein
MVVTDYPEDRLGSDNHAVTGQLRPLRKHRETGKCPRKPDSGRVPGEILCNAGCGCYNLVVRANG